jgi:isopentenyl diphosphate isomerase/L-lactate dehydrogenase-like FMN-dependent dehydrogenase
MGQKYGESIGMGGAGKGLSFTANVTALDRIKLVPKYITEHFEPDMKTTIFGQNIAIPIMPSSLSGVKVSMGGSVSEFQFAISVLQGAKDAETVGFIGNTATEGEELTGIKAVEHVGIGIPIFKPQSNQRLLELIIMAEKAGALALGVDVDGCGSTVWEKMGKPVYKKSASDLKELVDSTDLPFIVKGIMCVEDAQSALDAGAKRIDVSNHGGRILDSTRGVAEVLPEIVKAVNGRATITAGGGVRTGFDVLKMLALGANGILIGRDIIRAALGGGAEGVKLHLEYVKSDLKRGMLATNCKNINDIDDRIIYRENE